MSKTLKKMGAVAIAIAWILCITGTSQARYKKETISWVQQSLQTLNYYKGEITGNLDKATKDAIRAFQKDHHLKVNGKLGKKTRKAIKKALEEKAKEEKRSNESTQSPPEEK